MFDISELSFDVVDTRRRDCIHDSALNALNFVIFEISVVDVSVSVFVVVADHVINRGIELQSHIRRNSAPVVIMFLLLCSLGSVGEYQTAQHHKHHCKSSKIASCLQQVIHFLS